MQKADSNSSAGASDDSSTKDDATFISSNDAKPNVVGIPDDNENTIRLNKFKESIRVNGMGRLVCNDGEWEAINVPPNHPYIDEYIRSISL